MIKKLLKIIGASLAIFILIITLIPNEDNTIEAIDQGESNIYTPLPNKSYTEKEIVIEYDKEHDNYMEEEMKRIAKNKQNAQNRVEQVKDEAIKQQKIAEENIREFHMATTRSRPPKVQYREDLKSVPSNNSKKTYMDFRKITSRTSIQYKIQNSGEVWIDDYGFQRYGEGGMYVIALGTGYSPQAGHLFEITLSNGNRFKAITGDIKSDRHTDSENKQHLKDKSVVEFVVNTGNKEGESYPIIHKKVKEAGDMSKCPGSNMNGDIESISHIGENNKWK